MAANYSSAASLGVTLVKGWLTLSERVHLLFFINFLTTSPLCLIVALGEAR